VHRSVGDASGATTKQRSEGQMTATRTDTTTIEEGDAGTSGRDAIPEIARLLRSIDTCMLVTRGDDGSLEARPMSNNGEVDWDGSSWFFAPADGRLVAQIRRHPEALTAYNAMDRFAWVALNGTARVVEDDDAKRRLWLEELARWFPNGPDDPGVALIQIESTSARWWTEEGDGHADLRSVTDRR
jgi:general stress protein 26